MGKTQSRPRSMLRPNPRDHRQLSGSELSKLPRIEIGREVLCGPAAGQVYDMYDYREELIEANRGRPNIKINQDFKLFAAFVTATTFGKLFVTGFGTEEAPNFRKSTYQMRKSKKQFSDTAKTLVHKDRLRAAEKYDTFIALGRSDRTKDFESYLALIESGLAPDRVEDYELWNDKVMVVRENPKLLGANSVALSIQPTSHEAGVQQQIIDALAMQRCSFEVMHKLGVATFADLSIELVTTIKPVNSVKDGSGPIMPTPPAAVRLGPMQIREIN
ncbi:MAG: hypothetical protein M3Q79_03475 [bacterium]|nr:hypothetical protein [bacterium]